MLIIEMQVQTEHQAIVFQEEGSDNQDGLIEAETVHNKQEGVFQNELPLPGSEDESHSNREGKSQRQQSFPIGQGNQREKPTALLALCELDIGEEYGTQRDDKSDADKERNYKNVQTIEATIEEPSFPQLNQNQTMKIQAQVIPKVGANHQVQSSRMKSKNKFKDINAQQPGVKKSHKIVKKTQTNYQAGNITKGFFNQGQPQQVENQTTQNDLNKKNETQPFQRLNISMNSPNHRKLPPLPQSPKKEHTHPSPTQPHTNSSNKIKINDPNDSSIACLQKYEQQLKLPQNQVEHKSSFIYEEEEGNTTKFAMKKVPVGSKCTAKVSRQKNCPENFYHPEFSLLLHNDKFLLSSKKEWGHLNSHYNISHVARDYEKGKEGYAGYLKGNFGGTCFNLYSIINQKAQLTATICYRPQIKCSASYRMVEVYVKNEQYAYNQLQGTDENEDMNLQELYEIGQNCTFRKIIKISSKVPEWNQKKKCFVMSFRGKSNYPSVKNMILVDPTNHREALLFCKSDIHSFHMEVSHPLTPFIAFGIVLTAFDFKLLCE